MLRFEFQSGGRAASRPLARTARRAAAAVGAVLVLGLLSGSAEAAPAPSPPMILPSDAASSAAGTASDSQLWIVGARPGTRSVRIAANAGAKAVSPRLGIYRVPRSEASRFAKRLKRNGRLVYAEPDVDLHRAEYPADSLSDQQWWLDQIVSPREVTPPVVGPRSPLIGIIEESIDRRHPDLRSANLTGAKSLGPSADWHGTAIAGIIGSPGENAGIRGVWPGARMRHFSSGLKCSTASKAVTRAVNQRASVINLSYTFPAGKCFSHFVATQYAVRKGVVPVAAAGNTGDKGNAPVRPAADPHVLSVGAVDQKLSLAPFSTRNTGVDLAAPGTSVLAPWVDGDDRGAIYDWRALSGTSFAAPMAAATAAWLRQVRPELGSLQIARLMTDSATDLGEPGRDPEFGEGLLSIEGSLTAPNPPVDPYEPNDDIRWIDGSLLPAKTPFLWRAGAGKRRVITATLSRAKDPADVYRIRIPARRRIVVNVVQLEGNVIVSALKPRARTIVRPRRNLIVRSNRPYPKTEGIVVRNLKRRAQTIWLAITPSRNHTGNDFRYRVRVVRR